MRFLILGNGIYHLKLKKVTLLEYFAGLISVAQGTAVRAATKTTRGTALAMCHINKKLLATQPDHILPSPAPGESTPGSQHSSPLSPEAGSESLSGLSRAASSKSAGCTRHRQTSGQTLLSAGTEMLWTLYFHPCPPKTTTTAQLSAMV